MSRPSWGTRSPSPNTATKNTSRPTRCVWRGRAVARKLAARGARTAVVVTRGGSRRYSPQAATAYPNTSPSNPLTQRIRRSPRRRGCTPSRQNRSRRRRRRKPTRRNPAGRNTSTSPVPALVWASCPASQETHSLGQPTTTHWQTYQVLLVAVVRRLPRGGISLSKAEEETKEGCERFNDSTAVVCFVERTNLCGCRQTDRPTDRQTSACVCV
mmetsp:Transcript_47940/g.119950  ORF Transcript_47940/g.119950 Transcript_47940/m.119950 type:complete len:213 (-) Transcript_47940:1495-2133(-)